MQTTIIAGIIAISLQLILKPALSNVLGWLQIKHERLFRVGDFICSTEYEGVVKKISFNGVVLQQTDRSTVVLPNALITSSPIINKSAFYMRPITVKLYLKPDSDWLLIKQNFKDWREIIRDVKNVKGEQVLFYPDIKLKGVSGDGFEIVVQVFCDTNLISYRDAKNKLIAWLGDDTLFEHPKTEIDINIKEHAKPR